MSCQFALTVRRLSLRKLGPGEINLNPDQTDAENFENRRSGLRIASLIIELLVFICLLLEIPLFLFFSYWRGTAIMIFGITPLFILVGFVLATIGLLQRNRRYKPAAVAIALGILNGIGLCLVIGSWVIFWCLSRLVISACKIGLRSLPFGAINVCS